MAGTPGTALGALDRLLGSVTHRHQHPAGKITDLPCSGRTTSPVRDTWLLWVLYNKCFPGPATDHGAAHRYRSRAHRALTLCFTRFLTISDCVCINIHGIIHIANIYLYTHSSVYIFKPKIIYTLSIWTDSKRRRTDSADQDACSVFMAFRASGRGVWRVKPGLVNPSSADNTSRSRSLGVSRYRGHRGDTALAPHMETGTRGHPKTEQPPSPADSEGGWRGAPREGGRPGGHSDSNRVPTRSGTLQAAHPTVTPDRQKLELRTRKTFLQGLGVK